MSWPMLYLEFPRLRLGQCELLQLARALQVFRWPGLLALVIYKMLVLKCMKRTLMLEGRGMRIVTQGQYYALFVHGKSSSLSLLIDFHVPRFNLSLCFMSKLMTC